MNRYNQSVLIDSGFWIALFEEKDANHGRAAEAVWLLEDCQIILPWPTLYEFVNTRLARRKSNLSAFENWLLRPNVELFDDANFREKALESTFESNRFQMPPLSLVDAVLNEILADESLKIHGLITFNRGDFQAICLARRIEIFP